MMDPKECGSSRLKMLVEEEYINYTQARTAMEALYKIIGVAILEAAKNKKAPPKGGFEFL